MKNSEKILKSLSGLIENGILTTKDIQNEISTNLKFQKDKIINELNLVTREEFGTSCLRSQLKKKVLKTFLMSR